MDVNFPAKPVALSFLRRRNLIKNPMISFYIPAAGNCLTCKPLPLGRVFRLFNKKRFVQVYLFVIAGGGHA